MMVLLKYFKPQRKPVVAVAEGMTNVQVSQRGLGAEIDSDWAMHLSISPRLPSGNLRRSVPRPPRCTRR